MLEDFDEDEEDLKTVDLYIWEYQDGFVAGFVQDKIAKFAKEVEALAREEKHEFCYVIPELGLGGSIFSKEHITDEIKDLATKNNVGISVLASETFSNKYEKYLKAKAEPESVSELYIFESKTIH